MQKPKSEAESHFRRFEDMMKHILSVPKSEIDKREKKWKKERAKIKRQRAHK